MSEESEVPAVARLVFDGPATLRAIGDFNTRIIDAMAHHDAVEIDCSGLGEVDLSFVQLLLSARKTALACGKSLALSHPASGALLDALRRGGFLVAVDGVTKDDETFWFKGADLQ